jgi:hypothetical protein
VMARSAGSSTTKKWANHRPPPDGNVRFLP